jgi:predicted lipoprotein with Yx(FWY)xxD motif
MKRSVLFGLLLALCLFLVACGSQQTSSSSSTTTGSSSVPTPTPTATTSSSSTSVIKVAQAKVKGNSQSILTNAQGLTLYYFTPDTATTTACTGACASNWPALVFKGSGTPTGDGSLSGTLSVVSTSNGQQVAYNGHMLYTFAGDSAAGQTNGQGISGEWFVATPTLKPLTTQSTPTQPAQQPPSQSY